MPEPTWSVIRERGNEFHATEYRGLQLDVSRLHASALVRGLVVGDSTPPERFSEICTIEHAKARCVRIADRCAEDGGL